MASAERTKKSLMLGTCMWGWNVKPEVCHAMLDVFYEAGFREVDTASNYPMTGREEDYHLADRIISEWIKSHGVTDLKVNAKVGSIDNRGGPENNLTFGHLGMLVEYYTGAFGKSFYSMMVHWDNRESGEEINETIESLEYFRDNGLKIGLSGVKDPMLYDRLRKDGEFISIQCKRNLLFGEIERYNNFYGYADFYIYGINLAGIKKIDEYDETSTFSLREMNNRIEDITINSIIRFFDELKNDKHSPINELFDLNFAHALNSQMANCIIIGPSNENQLHHTISLHSTFKNDSSLPHAELIQNFANNIKS